MPNPQQLKERIYALNPELKELTFGCLVRVKIGTNITQYGRSDNVMTFKVCYLKDGKMIINNTYDPDRSIVKDDLVEILGHPIHLEHVLRAMKLTGHEWEKVTVKGNIMHFFIPKSESVTTIEDGVGINNEQYGSVTNYEWWSVDYDMAKTFDQNIAENEELVKFLLEVIK